MIREKTHWCIEGQHKICGGRVAKKIYKEDRESLSLFDSLDFEYTSPCNCECHKI